MPARHVGRRVYMLVRLEAFSDSRTKVLTDYPPALVFCVWSRRRIAWLCSAVSDHNDTRGCWDRRRSKAPRRRREFFASKGWDSARSRVGGRSEAGGRVLPPAHTADPRLRVERRPDAAARCPAPPGWPWRSR